MMRRVAMIVMVCAAAGLAYGQACQQPWMPACAQDKALEQVLMLGLAEEAGLDAQTTAELLDGYEQAAPQIKGAMAKRAALKDKILAAIDAGNSGQVTALTKQLMALDQEMVKMNMQAVNEAGAILPPAGQAKLYLLLSEWGAAKAALRKSLAGPCPCAARCAAPCAAPAQAATPALPPEEVILSRLGKFLDLMAAGDIEAVMAAVSDDFDHYEFGDKQGMRGFIDMADSMGYLADLKFVTEDTEVEIDGDTAVVYPVDVVGGFGTVTIEFVLKKQGGDWMLTTLDIAGL